MGEPQSPAEWRESLITRLNEQLPDSEMFGRQRIRWLAAHLEEYVDRWLGFSEHPSVRSQPLPFLFESGLYRVIGIALDLIEREVRTFSLPPQVREILVELQAICTALPNTHDSDLPYRLQLRTRDFIQRLDSE